MKKFMVLKKGSVYTLKRRGSKRLYRGRYTGRFFNSEMKCWVYNLTSLDKLEYYTLLAPETILVLA